MEAKKQSIKTTAIVLLVVGTLALLLGILGLVSGKSTDPYEARNGIAMVYATVYDNQETARAAGAPAGLLGNRANPFGIL
ncbi:MAG: hypothetical protein ACLT0Y_00595 [Christensenellales bacterium]